MARNVVVEVACDICGAEVDSGADTQFGLDGQTYAIDLCAVHRAELDAVLEPFVSAASPQSRTRRHRSTGAVRATARPQGRRDAAQTGAIRDWARANGFAVSDRGRIPREVEDAYNAKGKS